MSNESEKSVEEFLLAAIVPDANHRAGNLQAAKELLSTNPELVEASFVAGLVAGKVDRVTNELESNSEFATDTFPPKNWPAILYLCFSMFFRDDLELRPAFHEIARQLLAHNADPNSYFVQGDERETALYGAAGVANDPILTQMLLDAGADVNDVDASYHIAEFDSTECVKIVFEAGMNDDLKATTLLHKLDYNDPDGFREILSYGVDPNHQGHWGKSSLHQAIMRGRSDDFVKALIEFGANVNVVRDDGRTPFALAARLGKKSTMEILEQAGADTQLNEVDQVFAACALDDSQTIDEVLAINPDFVSRLKESDKVIFVEAARDGNLVAVANFLKIGIDLEQRGLCGGTALHWAGWHGQSEVVQFLLDQGANPQTLCQTYENTALGWCVYGSTALKHRGGNYQECVRALLQSGAKVSEIMLSEGTPEITDLLKQYR